MCELSRVFDIILNDSTDMKREGKVFIQMTYIMKTIKRNEKKMLNEGLSMFMKFVIQVRYFMFNDLSYVIQVNYELMH